MTVLVVLDHPLVALVRTIRVELDLDAAARDVAATRRRKLRTRTPRVALLPIVRARLRREIDVVIAVVDVFVIALLDGRRRRGLGRLGRLRENRKGRESNRDCRRVDYGVSHFHGFLLGDWTETPRAVGQDEPAVSGRKIRPRLLNRMTP